MTTLDTRPPPEDTGVEVEVDPRILARRDEVSAQGARRRRRLLAVVAACVAAVVAVGALALGPLLDVDRVEVHGAARTADDQVREAAAVAPGTPLVRVDTAAVARRVEALPWVGHAAVERSWPGTLLVRVEEREPVAFARRGDGAVALLDASGRVLGDVTAPPPGTVEVIGARRVPAPGARLLPEAAAGVRSRLPDALAARVTAIDVGDDGRGAALLVTGGVTVRLGALDDLRAKAAAALAVLGVYEERGRPVDYVDVRAPEAPVAGAGGAAPVGVVLPGLDAPLQEP